MSSQILKKSFYSRNPIIVAKELIGKILVRELNGEIISGRIIEIEAYNGLEDEAAHSYRGITKSNFPLFGPAGYSYVYSIHSHHCVDIVTGDLSNPTGVLIRALYPLSGIELMKKFRNKERLVDLTSGPGKICQALQITKELNNLDITKKETKLYIIEDNFSLKGLEILSSPRIGISKAKEKKYRFYIPFQLVLDKQKSI